MFLGAKRQGWSAFLGTNHFNNLQSLIVEAIVITTGSESAFICGLMQLDISKRVSSIKQSLVAQSDENVKGAVRKFIPTS